MKTVFISIPWFTPAYRAGGPIQSVFNLVGKKQEEVEYRIFCGDKDLGGQALSVVRDEWVDFNEHTKVWYAANDVSKSLTAQVEKLAPDVLYIIGIYSWHYNLVPLFFCNAPLKILSVRGMLHEGALAQKPFRKKVFLFCLMLSGITRKIVFHATDEKEADEIRRSMGKVKIRIAANYGKQIVPESAPMKQPGVLRMVTVALISPMKNHLKVLRALSSVEGRVDYNIYGPVKDELYWKQCEERTALLPDNISVHYHGEIFPEKVVEVVAENHVFIMPSESENFGHSLYESLCLGRPVITGNNTPWNRLAENKAGLNVDPDEKKIAAVINFFTAMDNETYKKYSEGALRYIQQRTDEKAIDLQYKKMFGL